MDQNRSERQHTARRMGPGDWLAYALLVGGICVFAGVLGWESTRDAPKIAQHDFRAVAHWFDPVFFQYNLLMVALAALVLPSVTLAYVLGMTGLKERRLHSEIPEGEARRSEIRERIRSRNSFGSYLGSVSLATMVVLLGASIILLFKPVPSSEFSGVDFSLGANVLMMGPFIELFGSDPQSYYIHLTRSLTAFQFGFLGAYIYFIGALARGYFTLDLTPQTFVDGTIRMMGASVLALVISFLPWIHGSVKIGDVPAPAVAQLVDRVADGQAAVSDKANPPAARVDKTAANSSSAVAASAKVSDLPQAQLPWNLSLLPIISFVFGFFPKWAMLALQRATLNAVRNFTPDNYRALPLSMLGGMSYSHELRLEREGFDNIENFSTADPVSLAVRTGFGYRQLVQWISEAWLATHLREDYPEFVRRTGIASRDELQLFFSKWHVAHLDAAEQLSKGISDSATSQTMKVKLAALETLLAGDEGDARNARNAARLGSHASK